MVGSSQAAAGTVDIYGTYVLWDSHKSLADAAQQKSWQWVQINGRQ